MQNARGRLARDGTILDFVKISTSKKTLMKVILTLLLIIMNISFSFAQDRVLSYTKNISGFSLNKDQLFDKVLQWFEKSFYNTKDKIKISNRQSGVISANAIFYSAYKVPNGTDSTAGDDFVNYNFEWTIKISNNQISFRIPHINITTPSNSVPVTSAKKTPYVIIMQSEQIAERNWALAKKYLMKNLDELTTSLYTELTDGNSGLADTK